LPRIYYEELVARFDVKGKIILGMTREKEQIIAQFDCAAFG